MPKEFGDTNRGRLFRNEEKESDTHADYSGSINVEGVEYWLNAWVKVSKKGTKFFSLSVKPKKVETRTHRASGPAAVAGMDDDLPF